MLYYDHEESASKVTQTVLNVTAAQPVTLLKQHVAWSGRQPDSVPIILYQIWF